MMKKSIQLGILLAFLVVLCVCGFMGNSARAQSNGEVEAMQPVEESEEPEPPKDNEMDLAPENAPIVIIDDSLLPEEPITPADTTVIMGEVTSADRPYLIGIDPGHLGYTGGEKRWRNTGAVSTSGTVEYEWALDVARHLRDELVERGYDVYLVRNTNEQDEFPYDYGHRAAAINAMDCDIMLGIHWDSFEDEDVTGYHVIYQDEKEYSRMLAEYIDEDYGKVVKGTIKRRYEPVGRDDLWELKAVTMPGIFVECGFASNPSESRWLEDSDNQELMAYGIADGIDAYFAYLEENGIDEDDTKWELPPVEDSETEAEETETEEKE